MSSRATITGEEPVGPTIPSGSYLSLMLGDAIDGGIVEHDGEGSLRLPYVEVADLMDVIERARALGAAAIVEPREGSTGGRSILAAPSGARIALWQSKV
jgi:predicted enzyme related to lactoylglutathione lyase